MKKYLFLLLVGFAHINYSQDYSNMSQDELNEAFENAVYANQAERVQKLLDAGADIHTEVHYLHTEGVGGCDRYTEDEALFYAIYENHYAVTEVLLQNKRKLNNLYETLIRAMEKAIYYGQATIAGQLIAAGLDINAQDKYGRTFLLRAINGYRTKAIVNLLLEAGANVCTPDKNGTTALMSAVSKHDIETVEALLSRPEMHRGRYFVFGAKPINYVNEDGNTALIIAIKSIRDSYIAGNTQEYNACMNSQKIVQILWETPGIDHHHTNNHDQTAVQLLEEWQKTARRY